MRKWFSLLIALSLVVAACGDDDSGSTAGTGRTSSTTTSEPDTTVDVVTVAPLEQLSTALRDAFAEANPDMPVKVTTVDDQAAITKAVDSADVVIAPRPWLVDATDATLIPLATTRVAIAVAAGNPQGIDLNAFAASSGKRTRICGEQTGLGNFTVAVLRANGIQPDPSTVAAGCEAEAVQQVAKGDLDAALLFRSGIVVPDGVDWVPIPDDKNIVIRVVAADVGGSDQAESFTSFIGTEDAKAVVESEGFLP